jgi:hypothetical protein
MKKAIALFFLIAIHTTQYAQSQAALFEAVMQSGSSIKAFTFVRNYFNLSASQDNFLHFKERGIKQLISFCDYRTRRIEATSLIKFSQTREFWKNYSNQFTAGKWNYKSLYANDSLAWQAANYSITLIYVHEMGHYMSLRFTQSTADSYTCEEYLANECLSAFANSFNGNKKLDLHKKLFLELVSQTARFVPDSNKTAFETPVKKWCGADPMKSYMHLYGSNDKEFLRFYGYTQFRMMEHALVNYTGERFDAFLNRKFYRRFNGFTGKAGFKPMKYSIAGSEMLKAEKIIAPWMDVNWSGAGSNGYFHYQDFNNSVLMTNPSGEVFSSFFYTENISSPDTGIGLELKNLYISTKKRQGDSVIHLEAWRFEDSVDEARPDLLSGWENKGDFHFLIKRTLLNDSLPVTKYQYYTLFNKGDERYSRRFFVPDSLYENDAQHNELLLAGTNLGFPLIIHNQLTKDFHHHISVYMIDSARNEMGNLIWDAYSGTKGFFNMYAPAVFFDTLHQIIQIAFSNPVTESIYQIKITNSGTKGYQFFNPFASARYPQQMNFCGISFVSVNKLYVLAGLPDTAERPLTKVHKLLIKL